MSASLLSTHTKAAYTAGVLLSLIGGFCDGTTFYLLDIFCGHVTGNTVLSIVALYRGQFVLFFQTVGVLAALALGMLFGALYGRYANLKRAGLWCVIGVTCFLAISFFIGSSSMGVVPRNTLCSVCCAFSLGILNEMAKQRLGTPFAVSYITGSTVSVIGDSVFKKRIPGDPHPAIPFSLNLFGFAAGAGIGVGLSVLYGINSLIFLIIPLFLIAIVFIVSEGRPAQSH